MEATDVLKLRVVLDDINAERLILPSRPESVNALIYEVKTKLNLSYDFRLQFQDPEFDNALCNLVNIEDLPSRATVKVVRLIQSDLSSTSTDDTIILSDNTDSPEHACRWPETFVVPTFSYEVEYALREGNCTFVKEGKTLRLSRDQKHNILDVMATGKAAKALVSKHPCLKENGSETGFEGWKNSLHFKMGNYRTKLSRAGIKDVAVNAGKRSRTNPEGASSRANIKRPKRGEVSFLPNYPVYSEFNRIANQNLPYSFFAAIDKCTPQLLKLYKKRRTGNFGEKMEQLLMGYEEQVKLSRIAALAGLPLYLKEDFSEIFKTCKVFFQEGAVALVAEVDKEEVPAGVPFETHHVSIILEDQVVMSHKSWPDSLVILFGLIYALNLSYPEKLSGFFEFIQVVLLKLDDGRKQLKPKLQALRNELE
uniref:PB1 domain-containing protein n=1 Tax=Amphiprion ocellaris TaxID=80972 RepID=A0A3Q1BY18_AMPOC